MADRVAVVGAGQMGNGIAHTFALNGFPVTLIDVSADALAQARSTIAGNLDRQIKKGAIEAGAKEPALARITDATDVSAATDAALVIEAASEDPALKFRLFAALDRNRGDRMRSSRSNTSSISITEIAARTRRPTARHRHALHESGAGDGAGRGDPGTGDIRRHHGDRHRRSRSSSARRRSRSMTIPGFVANRILMPMINEAVYCVMEGVATPEAIDTVMKLGMNHPLGPLALADLIGLDTCVAILDVLQSGLGDPKYRACPLLRKYVAAGWLGRKTKRGFYAYD